MKILAVAAKVTLGFILTVGKNSLNAQISENNAKYQENNNSDSLAATVNVRFMVNKSGQVQRVRALSVECDLCDKKLKKQLKKEAVRVVSTLPEWTSEEDAKPKNVWFILPMTFDLENYEIKN